MKIEELLTPAQMSSTDPRAILIEGDLWKYHPGFSHNFVRRWCVLTRSGFQYYQSKWSANCSIDYPLSSIPAESIRSIQRVHVEIPESTRLQCKKNADFDFTQYQVEVFVKTPTTGADAMSSQCKFSGSYRR